jgi:hypothetical protein
MRAIVPRETGGGRWAEQAGWPQERILVRECAGLRRHRESAARSTCTQLHTRVTNGEASGRRGCGRLGDGDGLRGGSGRPTRRHLPADCVPPTNCHPQTFASGSSAQGPRSSPELTPSHTHHTARSPFKGPEHASSGDSDTPQEAGQTGLSR